MKNKDKYYFSHDSNALSDPKIIIMRADYNLEGYGLFWALLEMMRNESDYKLEYSRNSFRAIKSLTNTSIDVEKYINDCIDDYKLFIKDEENNKFYSQSFLNRMNEYERKKEIKRENGKLGGRPKKAEKNQNETKEKPIGYEIKPIGFQNESYGYENETEKNQIKLNKSKLNEIKYITKLNKTFNLIINNNAYELEVDKSTSEGFMNLLERLEFKICPEQLTIIPEDDLLKFKIIYLTLFALYKSSYQVYLNKLTREKVVNKLAKTEKYIGNLNEIEDEKLKDFMAYFITCLQDDFDRRM